MKNAGARMRRRLHNGFTLIELMVTLSVLVILIAIATPDMRTFLDSSKLAGASSEFTSAMSLARSEAIKRARPVSITSASKGPEAFGAGWTMFVDEFVPTGLVLTGSTILANQQAFANDVRISSANTSTNSNGFQYFTYAANGSLVAPNGGNGSSSIDFQVTSDGTTIRAKGAMCMGWSGRARYVKNTDAVTECKST